MQQIAHTPHPNNVIQANTNQPTMPTITQTQTLAQLADYYGIHPDTLRRWLRAERLPLPRQHGRNTFTPAELILIHKTLG